MKRAQGRNIFSFPPPYFGIPLAAPCQQSSQLSPCFCPKPNPNPDSQLSLPRAQGKRLSGRSFFSACTLLRQSNANWGFRLCPIPKQCYCNLHFIPKLGSSRDNHVTPVLKCWQSLAFLPAAVTPFYCLSPVLLLTLHATARRSTIQDYNRHVLLVCLWALFRVLPL